MAASMTVEAQLAEMTREVLLLKQDLRDLFDALGLAEAARAPDPHTVAADAIQQASAMRRQVHQLKEAVQARVESSLANSV